jgi:hypothetical protein
MRKQNITPVTGWDGFATVRDGFSSLSFWFAHFQIKDDLARKPVPRAISEKL